MRFGPMNHVGVATRSVEKSVAFYRDLIGATALGEPFDLPAHSTRRRIALNYARSATSVSRTMEEA